MNKKAIAGILARLDDPEMIETVLDLIENKSDSAPAEPPKRQYRVKKTSKKWNLREHRDLTVAVAQLSGERDKVPVSEWWNMVADLHGHGRTGAACRRYSERRLDLAS
jgi:hypothetical protein